MNRVDNVLFRVKGDKVSAAPSRIKRLPLIEKTEALRRLQLLGTVVAGFARPEAPAPAPAVGGAGRARSPSPPRAAADVADYVPDLLFPHNVKDYREVMARHGLESEGEEILIHPRYGKNLRQYFKDEEIVQIMKLGKGSYAVAMKGGDTIRIKDGKISGP